MPMFVNPRNSKKKNCFGCRALNLDCIHQPCQLKHRVRFVSKYPDSKPIPTPVNKHCPKPRTYKELRELLKDRNGL